MLLELDPGGGRFSYEIMLKLKLEQRETDATKIISLRKT
jgi:hypothetical protein